MTQGGLRDTLARLHLGNQTRGATLSSDAVRHIRRRVTVRWAGSIGALVVAGSLASTALAGGTPTSGELATASPVPTPMFGFAAASFPLTGGPEFVPAAAGLTCGDPSPAPHSVEYGLKLEVMQGASGDASEAGMGGTGVSSARAVLSPVTNDVRGTLSTSGIDILVVQDGVIKGVFDGGTAELDLAISEANPREWPRLLVIERTHCPTASGRETSAVTPGAYQLVAIGRVFSTPESVALSQAVGSTSALELLGSGPQVDPNAVYLPGSYDCRQLLSYGSVARACLPDVTNDAVVDATEGTVSVRFRTKELVDEFSTVLVSDPLTVILASSAVLGPADWEPWDGISPFQTLDSFTCGAVGLGHKVGVNSPLRVEAAYNDAPLDAKQRGGTFAGTVFVPDAPDGSLVELLPGARLVFLRDYTLVSPVGMSTTNVSTVVASASLRAATVTADRFAGPQASLFTSEQAATCPGVEPEFLVGKVHAALVGQWRVSAPDGTVTLIDSANDPAVTYGYAR